MKKQFNVFLLLIAVHICGICRAQIRMEQLTVADGLTQGFITEIIQDMKGFLWIGTLDGLNKYDGYSIKRYTVNPFDQWSLRSSSLITALYEDNNHLLWVCTSEGLFVFEPLKERFFQVPNQSTGLPQKGIEEITGDRNGNIFVQMAGVEGEAAAIYKLTIPHNLQAILKQVNPKLPEIKVEYVTKDLWLLHCIGDTMQLAYAQNNDIFRYNYATSNFQPFDLRMIPAPHDILWGKYVGYPFRCKLPSGADTIIPAFSSKKTILLDHNRIGIWENDSGPFFLKKTTAPFSTDLSLSAPQLLHSASFNSEFIVLFEQNKLFVNESIADKRGILWFGTGGSGVEKVNLRQLSFKSFLKGKSVSSIRELPDGSLWILLYSGSSVIFHPKTGQIVQPNQFGTESINEIFIDNHENLWLIRLGSYSHPYNKIEFRRKNTTKAFTFAETTPFMAAVPEKIFQDRDGNIWIVAHNGVLYRCRPGQQSLEHFSYAFDKDNIKQLRSTSVMEDKDGIIWIGTNQGLIRMDQCNSPNPTFSKYQHNTDNLQSLSINWVTHILQDPKDDNILWLGTHSGGLNMMNKRGGTFSHFMESPESLPNNVVYGILADESGNLWCSTNRGLCKFNPAQNTFITYQESDGLLNTEFNTNSFLCTKDGTFWFGGVNGLNSFRPEDIRTNNSPPPVALTGIKVLGLPRMPDDEGTLTLSSEENNVLFEFSVLDFANNATNRYRYRMQGLDRDWILNGTTHTANFTALPPGRYVFEVQGATADSPWNEQSVLFNLVIQPPWFRTWYAYFLYFLIAGALLSAFIFFRERNIKLEQKASASLKESERLKEFDLVKNKFFANIAHELRTPLTVILGLADRIKKNTEKAENLPNVQQIVAQSNNLLHLSEQVLDLAKLESRHLTLHPVNHNVIDFIQQQTEALLPLTQQKGVSLSFCTDLPSIQMDFDPEQLLKILNNLITNAIIHTPTGGNICVMAALSETGNEKKLILKVKDTGEGIHAADLPYIFDLFFQGKHSSGASGSSGIGLTLTRDLVHLMEGNITVESTKGNGTTFTVQLPVQNKVPQQVSIPVIGPPWITRTDLPLTNISVPSNSAVVLVIEDHTGVANYLQMCLHPVYKTILAINGQDGIDKALEFMPDIIITDLMMPVKDGFEVLEFIKNDTRTSHIPVVILTAKFEIKDRLAGLMRGANAYVTKPFNETELLHIVHNLLETRQRWKNRYEKFPQINAENVPSEIPVEDIAIEDAFFRSLYNAFEQHYAEEELDLEGLCRIMHMSSSQLDRKIKTLTDKSPIQMLRTFRLQKAKKILLESPDRSVSDVCFLTGFKSPAHFSRLFTKEFGVSPSAIQ